MASDSATLTVTAKGQVTLRRAILDHLGVNPGDKLEVTPLPGGRVEVRARPRRTLQDFVGIAQRPGQPVLSLKEINEVIAKGWAGEP